MLLALAFFCSYIYIILHDANDALCQRASFQLKMILTPP